MQQHEQTINRVLLLAAGPHAQAVMQQVATFSIEWLGVAPPLYALAVEPDWATANPSATQVASLVQACDALADPSMAEELHRGGWTLAPTAELHVWLLLDITDDVSADAITDAFPVVPTAIPTVVQTLTELAWQRLRIHVALHALLLAEPAQQQQINAWGAQLASVGLEHLYVASPVNHAHLRLTATAWQQQTATVLAALLWGAYPSHTQLERSLQRGFAISAIGGAVWPSPLPVLRRWLALYTAQAVLNRLQQSFLPAPAAAQAAFSPLAPDLLPNLAQSEQTLAATVAPAPNSELWRGRHPNWHQLASLATTLAAAAARREERLLLTQRQARHNWLTVCMATWDTAMRAPILSNCAAITADWVCKSLSKACNARRC